VCVVLAGDHKQLGPLVRSPLALAYGLGVSMLERMMRIYFRERGGDDADDDRKDQDDDESIVTSNANMCMLVKNYRSHAYLLQLPSRLFYRGRLEACAHADVTHSLLDWSGPHEKRAHRRPLLFVGVQVRELGD
jgi:superfamily I DNA and/or RNA helicase